MREIWDELWDKRAVPDAGDVIRYDACYHLLNRLIELPEERDLNILEVGGGSGIYTVALMKGHRRNSGYKAVLVDYSTAALSLARKSAARNGVEASFILADAFKLPFPDDTFDIVWNGGVNEHFKDKERQLIFNEMSRVCKPQGQMVVIVPNSWNIPYRIYKKVLEVRRKWPYGFELPYSIFELKRRMKDAGLALTRASGARTLGSLFLLVELVPWIGEPIPSQGNAQSSALGILRRIFMRTDGMLGFLGGFTGVEIGVKGIKSADSRSRKM